MLRTVVLISILAVACCQYPRQRAPPPDYVAEPDYDDYQPRSRPPPPPPARVSPNSVRLRPATVHYVNIGAELAGDYKFGYDTGKGDDGQSFREETRLPDGSVQGAYGYVDETGKQRIVKYVAGKDGFRVLKDGEGGSTGNAAQPAQAYRPPAPAARAPEYVRSPPANRSPAPSQPARSAYVPPPPQPARAAYVPPPQPARAAYSPPPQAARVPPRTSIPVPRAQAYAPQPAYRQSPPQQRSYAPEPQPYVPPRSNSRPSSRRSMPVEEPDYDYDNEIQPRRLVPVDTSLFNYNIGTNKQ